MENNDIQTIEPIWTENFTAIAMSSSDEYVPYLSVCLESLVQHSNKSQNYDIIIFERNISIDHKQILQTQIKRDNISIRFINPMSIISQYNLKFPPHYNLECYFRLTTPLILKNYNKIIFTDVDLIFQKDIAKLYEINLDKPLAACQDLVYCAFLDTPTLNIFQYSTNELNLSNPYKYFNTGVMLINLKYFRDNNISQTLLAMANEKLYRILEQDILNKYFKENIKYIDDKWNFPTMNSNYSLFMNNLKAEYKDRYRDASNFPYIIHWAGRDKAWLSPEIDKACIWWSYARQSPFYETILSRMLKKHLLECIKEAFEYQKNILNYWKYKILYLITFGQKKKHYKNKKKILKNKIWKGKVIRGIR